MKYFSVRGSGSFPFDMLVLSRAWPASDSDAEKITLACPTVAPEQVIHFATQHDISGLIMGLWREKKWPITTLY